MREFEVSLIIEGCMRMFVMSGSTSDIERTISAASVIIQFVDKSGKPIGKIASGLFTVEVEDSECTRADNDLVAGIVDADT